MSDKTAFIEFLLAQNVLKFGDFTLKSGRLGPYFFNLGEVSSGPAYATLGRAYADALIEADLSCDVLFGPAYKGIPIAVATGIALAERGIDVGVAYNRKEAKTHGEGGSLVGAALTGRVVLIDDVLTSGKAIREALALLDGADVEIVGAIIAMDRQEVMAAGEMEQGLTAVAALAEELAAPVMSIATMQDLIDYLDRPAGETGADAYAGILPRMRDYQAEYCVL